MRFLCLFVVLLAAFLVGMPGVVPDVAAGLRPSTNHEGDETPTVSGDPDTPGALCYRIRMRGVVHFWSAPWSMRTVLFVLIPAQPYSRHATR